MNGRCCYNHTTVKKSLSSNYAVCNKGCKHPLKTQFSELQGFIDLLYFSPLHGIGAEDYLSLRLSCHFFTSTITPHSLSKCAAEMWQVVLPVIACYFIPF